MLLHIIHPYTYLASPDTKRDKSVRELTSLFLDHGQPTLHSWHVPHGSQEHLATFAGLRDHPHLALTLAAKYHVYTPQTGRPLIRETGMNERKWQELSAQYTPLEEVISLARPHPTHLLIGGYFESCVLDAALFLREHQPRATIFAVPDLCAAKSNTFAAKSRLFAHKIACISARDAERLVS